MPAPLFFHAIQQASTGALRGQLRGQRAAWGRVSVLMELMFCACVGFFYIRYSVFFAAYFLFLLFLTYYVSDQ